MMKMIAKVLFSVAVLAAALLAAAEPAVVAEWNFTAGNGLVDSVSGIELKLRGETELTAGGLKPVAAPNNVAEGAATARTYPDLAPPAFRLTVDAQLPAAWDNSTGVMLLWDNKYLHVGQNNPPEKAHNGFMFGFEPLNDNQLLMFVVLGFGDVSEKINSQIQSFMPGAEYTFTVEYDGMGHVSFRVDDNVPVARFAKSGKPVAPAAFPTAIGDRYASGYQHFTGAVLAAKLESLPVPLVQISAEGRMVFRSDEKDALLAIRLKPTEGTAGGKLTVSGKDGIIGESRDITFASGDQVVQVAVNPDLLPGEYPCQALFTGSRAGESEQTQKQEFLLSVGPVPDLADQLRYTWYFHPLLFKDATEMGFNSSIMGYGAPSKDPAKYFALPQGYIDLHREYMDKSLATGQLFGEALLLRGFKPLAEMYPRIKADGTKMTNNIDVSNPEAFELCCKTARLWGEQLGDHPAFYMIQTSSEVRDLSFPSNTEAYRAAWKEFSGTDVPQDGWERNPPLARAIKDFPAGHIIPDDWPLLAYYRWFWKAGDGWNPWQDAVKAAFVEGLGRDIVSNYDPLVRTPPIWGSAGETMNLGSHWIYPYPEPYRGSFLIAEEQAMARGTRGLRIAGMIQAISYRSALAPKEVKVDELPDWYEDHSNVTYMTTPPDMMREALWAYFMRQIDGIGIFGAAALFEMEFMNNPPNSTTYQMTDATTRDVIADEFHRVAIPLGPFLKFLPERAPEVAILESYASCLFSRHHTWGWVGEIFDYAMIATAAQLMPSVLYEEEIKRDGVPESVKVLILKDCTELTQSAYDGIIEFQKRGGIVIASDNLVRGILPDLKLPEFKRRNVGDKDKANLVKAAAKLRQMLAPYYAPYSDSDNADFITHVRTAGAGADCLFVLNDKREYGDYVGQWKRVLEKGLPNQGQAMIRRQAGAVYDLVAHQAVPFSYENGMTVVPLKFNTTDGRALLVTDKPLADITITAPAAAQRGTSISAAIASADTDVVQPVELRLTSPDGTAEIQGSGYAVLDCGELQRTFAIPNNAPAGTWTLTVTSLASGKAFSAPLVIE